MRFHLFQSRVKALPWFLGVLLVLLLPMRGHALQTIQLYWDRNSEADVVGYSVYYGTINRVYSAPLNVGNVNTASVSNLTEGTTYYFSVTALNSVGLESDFSAEVSHTVAALPVPTLDPLSNLSVSENSGARTVLLSGITAGGPNGTLVVSAASSDVALVPHPIVTYTSPNTTGSLRFAPVNNVSGTATITVTVDNGQTYTNRSFVVTVVPLGQSPPDPLAPSTNVFISLISNPIVLNPQTGLFEQTVSLTNDIFNTIVAVRLLIQGLPSDVQVYNACGSINNVPFVQHNFSLAAGAQLDLVIEYYRPNRQPIPQPMFVPQDTTRMPITAAGSVIPIANVRMPRGRFLIEFYTTPGRRYAVQYTSDMKTWQTAIPFITAPGTRMQWYDYGPPKTESKPSTGTGNRFYQIVVLP